MKKFIAAIAAAAIVAFSAVPAFAVSVDSPIATTQPETQPATEVQKPDTTPVSPKTGSADVALFSTIAIALAACGAASVVLAKSRK